ncbi:MAG TPA: electron transfer flavoprotein subunit alpha [Anaeromyxobacteraceae bacterium]|nr:electron transfer flavoprotein subunit alpha [Anaeromyxobacteraceae bacterium]
MDTVLFLSPVDPDGSLAKPALEALAAARELAAALSAPLAVGVFGAETAPAAKAVAGAGAVKHLAVQGPDFGSARYASDAAAWVALVQAAGASIVIAPHTSRTARVAAGATHRLGGRIDTHATSVAASEGKPVVTRWFYRQRMEALLSRPQRPWVLLLDPGCVAPWQAQGAEPALEAVPVALGERERRTAVRGTRAPVGEAQTIRPDAKLLFVAGAGWTKKQPDGVVHSADAEKLILGFLDVAKASLGSSKSLVDQSGEGGQVLRFMSHLNQVGQTGSTPRHPKGLATCCHGEEPHVVGWRFVGERRAVNLDPNCGWARGKADVLYVADAFAVIAKVNALLAAKKG